MIPPVASTLSDTDSGVEVTGAPGSSNQNQNSVAENTLRSWAVITPMPTYRPSCSRSRRCSSRQWSYRASSRAWSSTRS